MVHTPSTLARLAGALALGATLVAAADDAPPPELVSGASASMLAEPCAGCHGTDGLSGGPASPILAGMNPEYFAATMTAFREGKSYSTIMGRIAKGYSDDEIRLMAGYFKGKPFKAADQPADASLAQTGARLHNKYCEKCHTDGGAIPTGEVKDRDNDGDEDDIAGEVEVRDEEYQILAGQWTAYLQYAMEDFREGRREIEKKMKSKLKDLLVKQGDAGLAAIVAFYASEK